jgi:glycosyltransferase involved in cell wall biosynthesis
MTIQEHDFGAPARILMLTNALAPDQIGGLERYVRELSATLVRIGTPVTVLTKQVERSQPRREVSKDGIVIVRHPIPRKTNPAYVFLYPWYVAAAAVRELRKHPRAIVHGHYAVTTLPVALSGRRFLNTFHAPVYKEVILEHAGRYWLPGFAARASINALRRIERRVVTAAHRNFVLSEFMRSEVRQLSSTAAARTQVIPGGVDSTFFCEGEPGGGEWGRRGAPLLFTARRLKVHTGVEELVRAMPQLLRSFPEARLAIAGTGERRNAIEAVIGSMGLHDRVRMLGSVSGKALRGWYRAANLTVVPSQQHEGFGLITAESLCCGTPALVTPVGANPELVRELHTLLVAEDSTPEALANSLRRLLEAPEVLATAKKRSRQYAVERWSWDIVVQSYLDAYAELGRTEQIPLPGSQECTR